MVRDLGAPAFLRGAVPLFLGPGQGGQSHHGFEGTPGLPPGVRRPVELGAAVVPASHHGQDFAGPGIHGHQRRLEGLSRFFLPEPVEIPLQTGQTPTDGFLRRPLESGVQGGDDGTSPIRYFSGHIVQEVPGTPDGRRPLSEGEGLLRGPLILLL